MGFNGSFLGLAEDFLEVASVWECPHGILPNLQVLKLSVPKTHAFAFGLHLRLRSKTHTLGRGGAQRRGCDCETLAFRKWIAFVSFDLEASLRARACIEAPCVKKRRVSRLCG